MLAGAAALLLAATVFAAVYHAEVVAHRVGEPFGTLVLAVAVTVIEVSLIVSIMLGGGPETAGLARDTVFAAVMIICNGLVGVCLLWGGARHFEQGFQLQRSVHRFHPWEVLYGYRYSRTTCPGHGLPPVCLLYTSDAADE